MVENIAPWYHGAIWALREHRISYVQVRDSSAVQRLFVRLTGAVGRQSALHKKNSGFSALTVGRHISTFRGNRILFFIWNPYINRFTNHFSIHSILFISIKSDSHETWKCADPELERQIRCFPYGERSDVPRLQQVEQKTAEEFRTTYVHALICLSGLTLEL
jgi:hypothetical protein